MAAAVCALRQRRLAELFLIIIIYKMDSKIGFEMNLIVVEAIRTWTVCEFHGSNGKGFGYIWWTDNPIYFSSRDDPLIGT